MTAVASTDPRLEMVIRAVLDQAEFDLVSVVEPRGQDAGHVRLEIRSQLTPRVRTRLEMRIPAEQSPGGAPNDLSGADFTGLVITASRHAFRCRREETGLHSDVGLALAGGLLRLTALDEDRRVQEIKDLLQHGVLRREAKSAVFSYLLLEIDDADLRLGLQS